MRYKAAIILPIFTVAVFTASSSQTLAKQISNQTGSDSAIKNKDLPDENNTSNKICPTRSDKTLTLCDVIALTLIHNPKLKSFSLDIRAAEANQIQAGLSPNPDLDVEIENLGGTGQLSGFESAETSIKLSQLIELGNKAQKRKKVASMQKHLAQAEYESKKLKVLAEAAKAFISVLKAQQKLQLSNELLKISIQSFQTVEKRVDAGKDSHLEKTRAAVELTNLKTSNQQAKRQLELAKNFLASFWDCEEAEFSLAKGNLYKLEEIPPSNQLKQKLKQNPAYNKWQEQIRKNQAVLELEKSKAIQDVTLSAGIKRFNETDENAFIIGFSIPLPISNKNQGAKQRAAYELASSRRQKRAQWLKVNNDFNKTYYALANSLDKINATENELLPAAEKLFNAADKAYRQGKVDYLNVLDAQRTLFQLKDQYIETLAAYHSAKTDLEAMIGNQINSVNLSENEE